MATCRNCGAPISVDDVFCSSCGQRQDAHSASAEVEIEIKDELSGDASRMQEQEVLVDTTGVSSSATDQKVVTPEILPEMLLTTQRFFYVPSAAFHGGEYAPEEYERAAITTLAFKRLAERQLKSQLTYIVGGLAIAILGLLLATMPNAAVLGIVAVFGVLILAFGLMQKPAAKLRLSKAYCSFVSMPYDQSQLAFDLHGFSGYQTFDYATILSGDISARLAELPKNLAVENEALLIEKLGELTETAHKSKKESLSIPVAPSGHIIVACMRAASSKSVVGRARNELSASIKLEDCVRYVRELQALEKSQDVVDFLNDAASECLSIIQPFTSQLEVNLNTVDGYFTGLTNMLRDRLFGGFSYKMAPDPDIGGFETYDISELPEFANIVRPFQVVIDDLYQGLQPEIEKLKREFESEEARIRRELDRERRQIEMDTDRAIRNLQRDLDRASHNVETVKSRESSLRSEINAEESRLSGTEYQYRSYTYLHQLQNRLSSVEAELRAARADVTSVKHAIEAEQTRSQNQIDELEERARRETEHLRQQMQDDIKERKEPLLNLQKSRDQVIELGMALLTSVQTEHKIHRNPYQRRVAKIAETRDATVSALRSHSESRVALIRRIKNCRNELPFTTPTQISIPFWFSEITTKKGTQRYTDPIFEVRPPREPARSWTRDFVEFHDPQAPYSAYLQYIEQAFDQAMRYALSAEDLLSAARSARQLVSEGMISERCYSKMVEFFGGTGP